MNDKIEIKLNEGQTELIIREGEALPLKEERIVNISGTIVAPAEYYNKRKDIINPKKCNVIYSYRDLFIKLTVNEDNHYASIIEGKAVLNPDLTKFGINSTKTWTKTELKQFLKMNRAFFKDLDSNLKMVLNLEKFSASIQGQIDEHKDNRGNSKNNVEVKVDTNLDMNFTLQIPIFIGQETTSFQVEICFDVRDNGITIWLESPELQEAIIKQREVLIDKNIECFKAEFVLIEQ